MAKTKTQEAKTEVRAPDARNEGSSRGGDNAENGGFGELARLVLAGDEFLFGADLRAERVGRERRRAADR